jgi:HK97 gp10 family phage protein
MRWPVATFKLEGFRELDRALGELPKRTGKNVLKRVLMKAADPVDAEASEAAPLLTGGLQRSVVAGTRLTRSQRIGASFGPGGFRLATKNYVEVHVGTSLPKGMFQEFGTFKDQAQPWFRPAWESTKNDALRIVKVTLGGEIEKAAKRYAKKLAKGA